ncbi:uncharacterized protein LOC131300675 [Rhododendron vialii]|uniref:uncharacterized protein LOC131300675 n=1 Tax=Rhododendron vialii TaxID=182163 RepID=UPI00265E8D3C|nr:uncharacterized protein LOC131300675 [Rhododendron vialii]
MASFMSRVFMVFLTLMLPVLMATGQGCKQRTCPGSCNYGTGVYTPNGKCICAVLQTRNCNLEECRDECDKLKQITIFCCPFFLLSGFLLLYVSVLRVHGKPLF